jgi:hypothetical protein
LDPPNLCWCSDAPFTSRDAGTRIPVRSVSTKSTKTELLHKPDLNQVILSYTEASWCASSFLQSLLSSSGSNSRDQSNCTGQQCQLTVNRRFNTHSWFVKSILESSSTADPVNAFLPIPYASSEHFMLPADEPGVLRRNISSLRLRTELVSRYCVVLASKAVSASSHAVIAVDEGDIGRYTIKAAVDPRAANKTVRLEPPKNAVTQGELIALCEKLRGKTYKKRDASAEMLVEEYKGERIWMSTSVVHSLMQLLGI